MTRKKTKAPPANQAPPETIKFRKMKTKTKKMKTRITMKYKSKITKKMVPKGMTLKDLMMFQTHITIREMT